jgi:hypothetical protein
MEESFMSSMRILLRCLFLSILLTFFGCSQEAKEPEKTSKKQVAPQGTPTLELSLHHLKPEHYEVIVRLVVTNTGAHPLTIPHVTRELIEPCLGWGGCYFTIQDLDWRLFDLDCGRDSSLLQQEDVIQLKPGEHLTVLINIAHARWFNWSVNEENLPHPEVAEANGEYRVVARLRVRQSFFSRDIAHTVWIGEVESNPIHIMVQRQGEVMPQKLVLPESTLEGWRCHCRADCDPAISENPCLQLPLNEQSQTASVLAAHLPEAREQAKGRAREQLGGSPKPQVCFCVSPAGKPFITYQ